MQKKLTDANNLEALSPGVGPVVTSLADFSDAELHQSTTGSAGAQTNEDSKQIWQQFHSQQAQYDQFANMANQQGPAAAAPTPTVAEGALQRAGSLVAAAAAPAAPAATAQVAPETPSPDAVIKSLGTFPSQTVELTNNSPAVQALGYTLGNVEALIKTTVDEIWLRNRRLLKLRGDIAKTKSETKAKIDQYKDNPQYIATLESYLANEMLTAPLAQNLFPWNNWVPPPGLGHVSPFFPGAFMAPTDQPNTGAPGLTSNEWVMQSSMQPLADPPRVKAIPSTGTYPMGTYNWYAGNWRPFGGMW